ncbi:unnamed protein product, partial [Ectocarpus fasciculatus]
FFFFRFSFPLIWHTSALLAGDAFRSPDVVRRLCTIVLFSAVCSMMFGGSSLPLQCILILWANPNQMFCRYNVGLAWVYDVPCLGEEW